MLQDQTLGDARHIIVIEKVTTQDHVLQLDLNLDTPANRLVAQIAAQFEAGEGHSRLPQGDGYLYSDEAAPTDGSREGSARTIKFSSNNIHRGYKLKKSSSFLDMGKTLFENGVRNGDTIELHANS